MSFQSLGFLAFLAGTAAVCLTAGRRDRRLGRALMSAACMVFYLWGGGAAAFLVLAAGGLVSLLAVRYLTDEKPEGGRRSVAALAAAWHIGVLLAFKYTGFFTGGALSIGWAPLGLSFFTFQQLWLLREVYTGRFRPDGAGDLFLWMFFFPTVSSGPILKPQAFLPQLKEPSFLRPDWRDVSAGLYALCCGMGKKVLLADPLGTVVDNGWVHAADLTAPAAWLVLLGYTLQLYLDFSGYCDIAAGAARLLGLRLPVNFDSPYRALSVGDFWKRWHITLTGFLRECLYFPLGGSRRGPARTYCNILLVFLVSGLWHGAGWTFVVWGALHGLAQVAERAWGPGRARLPKGLQWALTFLFVNLAWAFFRAPTLSQAGAVLSAAVAGGMGAPEVWLLEGLWTSEREAAAVLAPGLAAIVPWLGLAALYGAGLLASLLPGNTIRRMEDFQPTAWRCAALAAVLAVSVLSFSGITTFIYSNF